MIIRCWRLCWLLAIGLLLYGEKKGSAAADARPNVILCMTDDQGWGDTGYNGHPVLRTLNLDRMAREGLRIDRFYAGAPVCSPTRGSCLTGRHPRRYEIDYANSGHIKNEEVTLAEALQSLGYATGHFGKWHLGALTTKVRDSNRGRPGKSVHFAPPWSHGFDVCFSTEAKVPTYWRPGDYDSYGTRYWTGADQPVPASAIDGDDSKLIMDQALPFVRQAVADQKPFFAVIWFHAPHLPVVSAPPYTDGYEQHQDYYGCITAMDVQLGRLRETLDKLNVAENTMLWFCSDNGPEGDQQAPGRTGGLRGRKRSLYEGGVRVPGLIVWPDQIEQGRITSTPCVTSDFFPTVLDALGLTPPESDVRPYDGVSLMPLMRGEMTERTRPIAFESRKQLALIDNRFKIYSSDGDAFELYDLIDDPAEQHDLAQRLPHVVNRMRTTLAAWRMSCRQSRMGADYIDAN